MSGRTSADIALIDELEKSREALLSKRSSKRLRQTLRRNLQSITRDVYIFRWIPEQNDDIYEALVDGDLTKLEHREFELALELTHRA